MKPMLSEKGWCWERLREPRVTAGTRRCGLPVLVRPELP